MDLEKKVLMVGIGGGGSNSIRRIFNSLGQGIEVGIIHSDESSISRVREEMGSRCKYLYLEGPSWEGAEGVGNTGGQESLCGGLEDKLDSFLGNPHMVVVTMEIEGEAGSGWCAPVSDYCRQHFPTIARVIKPSPFEGKKRQQIFEETVEKLVSSKVAVLVQENESLNPEKNSEKSFNGILKNLDNQLIQAIKGLTLHKFSKGGREDRDFDINSFFERNNSAPFYFGSGAEKGGKSGISAWKAFKKNPHSGFMPDEVGDLLLLFNGALEGGLPELGQALNEMAKQLPESVNLQYDYLPDLDKDFLDLWVFWRKLPEVKIV